MTLILPPPVETALIFPDRMGMQAMPGEHGETLPGPFHMISACEYFGVDQADPTALTEACKRLISYENHGLLMRALQSDEIDIATTAVDNNNSGRVVSAIEALRGGNYSIMGKIAITVDQHLLLPTWAEEADIKQAASQLPALRQAEPNLPEHWIRHERPDTVGSALEVAAAPGGKIDGLVTAAIASRMAGEAAGLKIGRRVSPDGNATTFWIVTTKPEKYPEICAETPTHAAFTFSTADAAGSLLEVVRSFSQGGKGLNFTDIDCHLSPDDSKHPIFFAEVALNDPSDIAKFKAVAQRLAGKHALTVLGIYPDKTRPELHTTITRATDSESAPIPNVSWHGRNPSEGSTVVYVQSNGQTGSLEGMLTVFDGQHINLSTMTRPIAPDNNGRRGFGFVMEPGVFTPEVITGLARSGYDATPYTYAKNKLHRLAV